MVYLVFLVLGVAILTVIAVLWFIIALLYLIITSANAEKQNESKAERILRLREEMDHPFSLNPRVIKILLPPAILTIICIFLNIYISPLGGPY